MTRRNFWSIALPVASFAFGCQGTIDNPPGGGGAQGATGTNDNKGGNSPTGAKTEATCTTPTTVSQAPVRRLSRAEYNRTLSDLFPGLGLQPYDFPDDLRVFGFENNASALNPAPVLVERYNEVAQEVAQTAAGHLDQVLPCQPSGDGTACAAQFIETFGQRAFRRPLTDDQKARYVAFFAQEAKAISFNGAVELTIQAMLQAPQFLYRLEGNSGSGPDAVPLDPYERASRLSYFLWQSMPDDELFRAASAGELSDDTQIEAQARRMIADPKATTAIVDFHRQWLDFDRLLSQNKEPTLFPDWNVELRDSIREESNRFVSYVFSEGGGTLAELLTSPVGFVNGPLAKLYGVDYSGTDWQQVNLPADQRPGLLTRGTFLASLAHSTNGSPPLRGVAVLDHLLCSRPPPPPMKANTSTPTNSGELKTNRQLFEERTAPALCQGCHKTINGIGFGFEAYDSTGAFRTTDNGLPLDTSGAIHGTDVDGPYNGAAELVSKLAESTMVEHCVATNWFRYAFGRKEDATDACKIDALADAVKTAGGDVRELLVHIVSSKDFLYRIPSN